MSHQKQAKQEVALNTVTDTGVGFEIGNAAIAYPISSEAAAISLTVAGLCATARGIGESKKTEAKFKLVSQFEKVSKYVPSFLKDNFSKVTHKMSENLGFSLMISGSALMGASLIAASNGLDLSSVEAFYGHGKEAAVLGLFGVANFIRGHARGFDGIEEKNVQKNIQDAVGIVLATIGVGLTGDILDIQALQAFEIEEIVDAGIKGVFGIAALTGIVEAFKNDMKLPIRGDLVYAGGCLGNAAMTAYKGDYYSAFANLQFLMAYISMDALKHDEGLYHKFFSNSPKPSSELS